MRKEFISLLAFLNCLLQVEPRSNLKRIPPRHSSDTFGPLG